MGRATPQSGAVGFARGLASASLRGSLARGCVDDERSAIRVLIITGITVVLVLLAVGVHYEALSRASNGIRRLGRTHRIRVAVAVLAALAAHFVEVILFAFGWEILLANGEAELSIENPSFAEILYFSASTYTSLGYGDIVPLGDSGLLAGSQALTGLVLIAWTASFTYFEMLAYWGSGSKR